MWNYQVLSQHLYSNFLVINYHCNIMKRFALFLFVFVSCFITEAQVCKISNSNDNVEVFSASIVDNSKVVVTVGNDSQDISANVTVEITVTYGYDNYKKTYSGKKIAKPNTETVITIPISSTYSSSNSNKPSSVTVTRISGTKCSE